MRHLTTLRHAMRNKPGAHLNAIGISQSRHTGARLGTITYSICSTVPRAVETVIAMGYAPDLAVDWLSTMPKHLEDAWWNESATLSGLAQIADRSPTVAEFIQAQTALVRTVIDGTPDGADILMVSHGGMVEAHVMGMAPTENLVSWGPVFGYCEGARITLDGDVVVQTEQLRNATTKTQAFGGLIFSLAHECDLPALVALLADDVLGAKRERLEQPLPDCYGKAFKHIGRDQNSELIVVRKDAVLVGTLQLTRLHYLGRQGAQRMLIESVRVASGMRNQGIGRSMLLWAIERAREHGCAVLQLTTDKSRRDAHRFYERLGFVASHDGMKLEL